MVSASMTVTGRLVSSHGSGRRRASGALLETLLTLGRKFTVENSATGETFEDDADVLINARGNLNEIAWPQIPGFKSFKGEVMHSAAWNEK